MADSTGRGLLLLVFIFVWLIPSIIISSWASSKGRSGIAGFLLSFCFSPLIGAIVVGLMSRDEAELERRDENLLPSDPVAVTTNDYKKCPYCAEMIRTEAIVCRYCNREV